MSGWDKAQERSKQVADGIFVKFDDGDKVIVTFCGEPHVEELFWNQKLSKYEAFDAKTHSGNSTPKYKLNVFVWSKKASGSDKVETIEKMQIVEVNNNTFKDVLKARDKYGLDKWSFEMERSGKKGDTKTTYSVLPEAQMNDEQIKKVAAAKLHDLAKSKDEGDGDTDMNSHDKKKGEAPKGDATITPEQSAALVARLKVLPREKLQPFLQKFGVAQVKAIKASDFEAATKAVDELEGKPAAAPPAAPAEADPFA